MYLPAFHMAFAEVVFDGSMNASMTDVKLEGHIEIKSEYGKIAGQNLFHSFTTFNVNSLEQVTFTSEQAVQNIIARVTGNNSSTINGPVLSNIDHASLFLINPYGIIFGDNASINIDGSFYVGTADYVASNEAHFNASIEADNVLFTENPTSFGFLSDDPQKMVVSGLSLKPDNTEIDIKTGQTLSFISGGIEVNDAALYAKEGTINLSSVASKGEIDLTDMDQSNNALMGDIEINHSEINVSGDGSGDIYIRGGRILITNESSIVADNTGSQQGGQTKISGQLLTIDHSNIYRNTISTGDCGQIKIKTDKTMSLINLSRIYSDSETDATGNAGSIEIKSQKIQLINQSKISSDTYGDGQGGAVELIASDNIQIMNECEILTVARGKGDGGDINIQSPNISIVQNSKISTDTMFGHGNGGTINLSGIGDIVAESVAIFESKIYSGAVESGFGNGGTIHINAKTVSFINGAEIESESDGRGKGGEITIHSSVLNFFGEDAEKNPSGIYTTSKYLSDDAGDAGNISLYSDMIRFQDQSQIIANTEGPGQAGQIIIDADVVELTDDSSLSSTSMGNQGAGSGGTIDIHVSSELNINHANILTSSFGDGHAGHISIAAKWIQLSNQAGIRSESKASNDGGTAGKISVMADEALDIQDSFISTEAVNTAKDIVNMTQDKDNGHLVIRAKKQLKMINGTINSSVLGGMGNGGDIDIDPEMVLMQHSQIIANAYEGNGGNIHIVADHFIQSADSIVQASSEYGFDGNIFIDAPDARIGNELVTLPSNYLDASQWLHTPCSLRTSKDVSRLVISGRDAIPSTVEDLYMSPALTFLADDGSDPLRVGEIEADFFKGL
jgi:filamentous hemagglutinin family protein